MSDRVDCVVVGAGVVGLAVGRALAASGREVVVLERNSNIGEETSSRNSEVIHAGLYYPTASLKAKLCVAGKSMLYDYCEHRQVAYQRCGKLIVATTVTQLDRLDALAGQARLNDVDDIERIDEAELLHREPEICGVAALWSPSTGIIDSHALMMALAGDIESANGIIATETEVHSVHVTDDAIRLEIKSGDENSELLATTVVNAGGLNAIQLAANCSGIDTSDIPTGYFAKGNYFAYSGRNPFQSLIYPLPVNGGLGIHATFDLGGKLRFGPDVEWIDEIDYLVDASRRDAFTESIRTYWPSLKDDDLVPDYSGIRPKLARRGNPPADFQIKCSASGGARQLVHLFGIESPGLTASFAIAEEVRQRIVTATAQTTRTD